LFSTLNFAHAKTNITFLSRSYTLDSETEDRTTDTKYHALFQQILGEEFSTQSQWTNHARLIKRLSSKEAVCSYNLIKTPQREANFLFSDIPTTLYIQRKLFAHKDTIKNLPKKVSVSTLLSDKNTFAIIGSTSYKELDKVFAAFPSQVISINGTNSFEQLAQILAHKRIDMIVDHDHNLKTLLPAKQYEQLDSREISEYPEFISGYFVCSKTKSGKQAIDLMNNAMKTSLMYNFIKEYHYSVTPLPIAQRIMQMYKTDYNLTDPNEI